MANAVLELRAFLDMSQGEMADTMDCYQAEVSQWERGLRAMSATTALRWWSRFRRPLREMGFRCEDLLKIGRP